MSIRAVFRVQCDGPGKEWLSWPKDYVLGTDLPDEILVAEPTAIRACNWPSDHAARAAALGAGWFTRLTPGVSDVQWWCPGCRIGFHPKHPASGPVCICTHPKSQHNVNDLCIALPGVLGCGCLGFAEKWTGS